jgi:hypothetical protein
VAVAVLRLAPQRRPAGWSLLWPLVWWRAVRRPGRSHRAAWILPFFWQIGKAPKGRQRRTSSRSGRWRTTPCATPTARRSAPIGAAVAVAVARRQRYRPGEKPTAFSGNCCAAASAPTTQPRRARRGSTPNANAAPVLASVPFLWNYERDADGQQRCGCCSSCRSRSAGVPKRRAAPFR